MLLCQRPPQAVFSKTVQLYVLWHYALSKSGFQIPDDQGLPRNAAARQRWSRRPTQQIAVSRASWTRFSWKSSQMNELRVTTLRHAKPSRYSCADS